MKKLAWLSLLPLVALAATRDDYAGQWPLALPRDDGGAYRVVLDREVYRQLQSPRLQDLVVVNAQGTPVATAVFPADAPLARSGTAVSLPWFPLPVDAGTSRQDSAAARKIMAVVKTCAAPGRVARSRHCNGRDGRWRLRDRCQPGAGSAGGIASCVDGHCTLRSRLSRECVG